MNNTKWMQSYVRKTSFSVLAHLNPVSQPMKTPTKIMMLEKKPTLDFNLRCGLFD